MIYDKNSVTMEGVVVGEVKLSDLNHDRKALNIVLKNRRGKTEYTYNVVFWDDLAIELVKTMKTDDAIRVTGFLQQGKAVLADGKKLYYSKFCGTKVEPFLV